MSALYDRLIDAAARHGFNGTALRQHLRTACAVCLAVAAAWLLGLQHPQWAGMTVWAASQPLRGQMLEKSLFRVTGTVVGAAVGPSPSSVFWLEPVEQAATANRLRIASWLSLPAAGISSSRHVSSKPMALLTSAEAC